MTQQNRYEKTYNCSCGTAFNTLKELDKHNHEEDWIIKVPLNLIFTLLEIIKNRELHLIYYFNWIYSYIFINNWMVVSILLLTTYTYLKSILCYNNYTERNHEV